MATFAETVSLAVMVLFGLATAGFLAFMARDLVARIAAGGPDVDPDGTDEPGEDVRTAQRVAMSGSVVYLLGFVLVAASTLLRFGPVGGVSLTDVGILAIVLAAVPMAAGLYMAWQTQ